MPGNPTVVRPPAEIELNPPLERLTLGGPSRAERQKRKPVAISEI